MSEGMRSKQSDYQYALTGIGFAGQVLKHNMVVISDIIKTISGNGMLEGETGKEYVKKLNEVGEVVNSTSLKFNSFANAVEEKCRQNGAFVDDQVMSSFDDVQKRFATFAEEVKSFKGKK